MTVDVVVKVGGGLLAHERDLDATLAIIGTAARARRLVVVPGGGPFADAVREVCGRLRVSDTAAHWMAVLAMDQDAHLLADRIAGGILVAGPAATAAAIEAGRVPVLAPSPWLREADPLPHSWDVTSDSLAAWVAQALGAGHLVLVKPPGAGGDHLVDAYFPRALHPGLTSIVVPADRVDALRAALNPGPAIG